MIKPNQLVLLGTTFSLFSTLSLSDYGTRVMAIPSSDAASPTPALTEANPTTIAQSQPVAIMSGNFLAAEKPTTGQARIVTENGHRYLELDGAFSTSDQGPDLHVLLDPSTKPPQSYQSQQAGSYVNLGKLQKFKGTQRYAIPDGINLPSFKSVSIWCRMANATFGYAPLRPASSVVVQ